MLGAVALGLLARVVCSSSVPSGVAIKLPTENSGYKVFSDGQCATIVHYTQNCSAQDPFFKFEAFRQCGAGGAPLVPGPVNFLVPSATCQASVSISDYDSHIAVGIKGSKVFK